MPGADISWVVPASMSLRLLQTPRQTGVFEKEPLGPGARTSLKPRRLSTLWASGLCRRGTLRRWVLSLLPKLTMPVRQPLARDRYASHPATLAASGRWAAFADRLLLTTWSLTEAQARPGGQDKTGYGAA
jgi:hypothetical protein